MQDRPRVERMVNRLGAKLPLPNWLAQAIARRFMDSPERLRRFWNQASPPDNAPEGYAAHADRSRALVHLLSDLPKSASILEVGCNVGRNLHYLKSAGFSDVAGIEINSHAVALLREIYPDLAHVPIHVGPAELILPTLEGPYDLVFTMAVLEHIHPDNAVVFDEIARVARVIIAIEPPRHISHRQFPHDLVDLFSRRGFVLESRKLMRDFAYLSGDSLSRYAAYRFRRQTDTTG